LNTLFQLYSVLFEHPWMLHAADRLLFMPDLFNFWLTGVRANEFTISSTSQMYDMRGSGGEPRGGWATDILEKLGIPTHFLGKTVSPGTLLGPLASSVQSAVGQHHCSVFTVCCHDTASAVFAVPADQPGRAYLSSGTWSLLGVEIPQPLINAESLAANFTNEGGFNGSIRFLKNIMGLWILQECRREWESAGTALGYGELARLAEKEAPFVAFLDVNSEDFLFPGDMPGKIARFCRRTGQRVPEGIGAMVRVILESLALEYRSCLERFEGILGSTIEVLHVVGGGSQNETLAHFTADATGKTLVCGPVEATSLGNIGVQMIASGRIAGRKEFHELVNRSCALRSVEPCPKHGWDDAYEKFLAVKERSSARI